MLRDAHRTSRRPRGARQLALVVGVLLAARVTRADSPAEAVPPPPAPPSRLVASWADVLSHARARSTDLRAAYADVKRAEGQWRVALGALLPNVSGSGSFVHQFITNSSYVDYSGAPTSTPVAYPAQDVFTGQLIGNQTIVSLQQWQGLRVARADEDAARLSVSETRRRIVSGVVAGLVAVAAAERVVELNRIGLRGAIDRLGLVVRRRGLDVATNLDVMRAQQDVERARTTLVLGDESLRQAREAFGLALGLPEEVGIAPGLDLRTLDAAVARSCPRVPSPADRSDILAARARLEASARRVTSLRFSLLPTLSAQSQLATSNTVIPPFPTTTWTIGAFVSVPIVAGGSEYGAIQSADAQRERDDAALTATVRSALVDVEQAKRAVAVADGVLAVAQEENAVAAGIEQSTRAAFQDGRATSLELVVAASELREAQTALVLREFDAIKARALQIVSLADCTL
jgi:outer membrane protein TolC